MHHHVGKSHLEELEGYPIWGDIDNAKRNIEGKLISKFRKHVIWMKVLGKTVTLRKEKQWQNKPKYIIRGGNGGSASPK